MDCHAVTCVNQDHDCLPAREYMSDDAVQEAAEILQPIYVNFGTKQPSIAVYRVLRMHGVVRV